MLRKTVVLMITALLVTPGAVFAAGRDLDRPDTLCAPIPVSTGAKDVHVGSTNIHVFGLSEIRACVTTNHKVGGTPTITAYENCGTACFAARVADVSAAVDVKVELAFKQDGEAKSVPVDPEPVGLGQDTEEVCISNHDAGTPDPCLIHLTSPSDLRASGGAKQITLRWKPGSEAYGRSVITTYEVWRSTTTELETFEMVASGVTTTNFVDKGLTKKTTYSYFVVAVDDDDNRSGGSNVAEATTN